MTFRGPCIVIYCYNKSEINYFSNLFLIKDSTCFRHIYCPSTGVWPHQQTVNRNRCVNKELYYSGRTYCIFWNIFTILTFSHNIEFYLQHVIQFNYNVYVYTLVTLSTFKISAWQIPTAVCTVLRLLMMDSRSVQNM